MGRAWGAWLLLLPSCAQLFSIDETTGAAGADANTTAVSAQLQRITVGPTTTRTPYDISAQSAAWFVADASDPSGLRKVPAMVGATTDTWTAPITEGSPAFEITLGNDYPDSFRRLYDFHQRNLKILYGIYEQPNATPAPMGGAFNVTLTLPSPLAAGEAFQLYSLGAWANHGLGAGELPAAGATTIGPVAIPYNATTWGSVSGRPLTAITRQDLVVALRYINSYELSGVAEFPAFDQTGGTDALTATMTNNPRMPLDFKVDPPTISARLNAPVPAGVSFGMSWSAVASPGYAIGNATGPLLNAGGLAATDTGAITAPFGNPFGSHDWQTLVSMGSNKSRTFAISQLAGKSMTLYTGINESTLYTPGVVLDAPVPLPVLATVAGTSLMTDGQTVTLDPTKAVELGMNVDTGTPLYYQWNIYELRLDMATMMNIETHVVYAALATTPKVTIPNDVLVGGKVYLLRAHCITGGYPGFAEGDLWQRNTPSSVGYLDVVFSVAPP